MSTQSQAVIARVNREHKLGLEDILYVYGKISVLGKVNSIRLLSVELDSITIRFRHDDIEGEVDKLIAFDEPLGSMDQVEPHLLQMMQTAANQRGLSPVQVEAVQYPNCIGDTLVIFGVLLPPLCYKFRSVLYMLSYILPSRVIQFLDSDQVLLTIIILEFLTHFLETLFWLRPKLMYYRVPTDYCIEWYLLGLLEGYAPVRRLQQLAKK